MAKLFIIIKGEYFNQILSETKKEEYRIVKPFWAKKIIDKKYSHIIFQKGYNKNTPRIEAEYLGYEIRKINHKHFGELFEMECFVLKLGNIRPHEKTLPRY